MLTSYGLTFSAGSLTMLAIDRKSRMSFYYCMWSRALIVLPNNAKYACPDSKSIADCRACDKMHWMEIRLKFDLTPLIYFKAK